MKIWCIGMALLLASSALAIAQSEPVKPQAPSATEAGEPPPAYSVVEPKTPKLGKKKPAAKAKAPTSSKPAPRAVVAPRVPPSAESLKPTGPCVIKPVMSDQDLVNCGATPRH